MITDVEPTNTCLSLELHLNRKDQKLASGGIELSNYPCVTLDPEIMLIQTSSALLHKTTSLSRSECPRWALLDCGTKSMITIHMWERMLDPGYVQNYQVGPAAWYA